MPSSRAAVLVILLVVAASLVLLVSAKRSGKQKLKACCARQKSADKECKRRFCDFDAMRQENVHFFVNMCTPRNDTVPRMWDCVTGGFDHRECCKRNGVSEDCLPYCNGSGEGLPVDYVPYIHCLRAFNPIRNCFQRYLDTHPNIFGDD